MLTLPGTILPVLIPFATLFRSSTWQKAQVLLVGAVLSPGQRTVASALRVMGLSGDRNYARYHHVLNRAAWSPLQVSRVLLRLLLQHLDRGNGPLVFGIDETPSGVRDRRSAPLGFTGMRCAPAAATWSRPAACAGSVSCGWAAYPGPDATGPCRC